MYVVTPVAFWGLNLYDAKRYPLFSSHLFDSQGARYNLTAIFNDKFELDLAQYERHGRVHLSTFFALIYGFGFAGIAATVTHVALFHVSRTEGDTPTNSPKYGGRRPMGMAKPVTHGRYAIIFSNI